MKPKSILYWRIYSGCYQNPVSSNPVFFDLESGFSIAESGFLNRESEHESGFFPSPGFLRVRVRVRSGFRSMPLSASSNTMIAPTLNVVFEDV